MKHHHFDSYTIKQAMQEGFILDVLRHYTPVESDYKLVKKVEDEPEFDTKKAKKKLRRYVESHEHVIKLKAEIHPARRSPTMSLTTQKTCTRVHMYASQRPSPLPKIPCAKPMAKVAG